MEEISSKSIKNEDNTTCTSTDPPFIESFGFNLACHLLGSECVSKAIAESSSEVTTSSRGSNLFWRSPLVRCRDSDGSGNSNGTSIDDNDSDDDDDDTSYTKNAHIYFIDVHWEFSNTGTHHNENSDCNERTRKLFTKFGALVKTGVRASNKRIARDGFDADADADADAHDDTGAVYLQSKSLNLLDLESYANGTGICVDETGPLGMAKTIASSLLQLHEPRLKTYHIRDATKTRVDTEGDRSVHNARSATITAAVDIFHLELLDRVMLFSTKQSFSEGHIGGRALSLMIESLAQEKQLHPLESYNDNENGNGNKIGNKVHGGMMISKDATYEHLFSAFKAWRTIPRKVKIHAQQIHIPLNVQGEESSKHDAPVTGNGDRDPHGTHNDNDSLNGPTSLQAIDSVDHTSILDPESTSTVNNTSSSTCNTEIKSTCTAPQVTKKEGHDQSPQKTEKHRDRDASIKVKPPPQRRSRPKIVHGAARVKKRKKTKKMTFQKT